MKWGNLNLRGEKGVHLNLLQVWSGQNVRSTPWVHSPRWTQSQWTRQFTPITVVGWIKRPENPTVKVHKKDLKNGNNKIGLRDGMGFREFPSVPDIE